MLASTLAAAADGLALLLTWPNLLYPVFGTLLAMVVALLPGINGVTLMALALPLVLGWEPVPAVLFFSALVGGATFMGSVTAILFNIPGTGPNAATLIDGHPMAMNGEARTAIACSATASALGSTVGIGVLILLLPLAYAFVLSFGPLEFVLLALWGLLTVVVVSRGHWCKGVAAAGLGLLLAFVGRDPRGGEARFTFGSEHLLDGLPLVAVFLGLFSIAQTFELALGGRKTLSGRSSAGELSGSTWAGIRAVFEHAGLFLRSSVIGTAIGAIPGIGGTVASFVAYAGAVQTASDPGRFGRGDIRGVLAPEAANDAKDGGSLLPVFVFGIPGSEGTAVFVAVLILFGFVPGPEMLANHGAVLFAAVWALLLSNWLTSVLGLLLAGWCARLSVIPVRLLVPLVLVLAAVGALAVRGSFADLVIVLVFGLLGFAMARFGWPRAPLVIAFVLGGLFERNLHLALQLQSYGRLELSQRPVAWLLMVLIAGSVFLLARSGRRTPGGAR